MASATIALVSSGDTDAKGGLVPAVIADVAALSLFLASHASDMISGQNIAIDGGW